MHYCAAQSVKKALVIGASSGIGLAITVNIISPGATQTPMLFSPTPT